MVSKIGKVFDIDFSASVQWEIINYVLDSHGLSIEQFGGESVYGDFKLVPVDIDASIQWSILLDKLNKHGFVVR